MPAHYVLSDAAIVLVSLFAGQVLWRNMKALPAFAMACFGVAACIGVVRFGGGLQDALAALHSGASQYLGLAGAFAILAHYLFPPKGRNGIAIIVIIISVALAIFWFAQVLTRMSSPVFVVVKTPSSQTMRPRRHRYEDPVFGGHLNTSRN